MPFVYDNNPIIMRAQWECVWLRENDEGALFRFGLALSPVAALHASQDDHIIMQKNVYTHWPQKNYILN